MYEIYEKLLKSRGLKSSDVSKATGISNMTFSDWKNKNSAPKPDKLSLIADYFGVTVDFLMGRTDLVICPICGFGNNPLSEQSRVEHDLFHKKFVLIKSRYPFIMKYSDAVNERDKSILGIRSFDKSIKEKKQLFEKYLMASFSIEVSRDGFDSNLKYEDFCKREISQIRADWAIPQELIDALADEYGYSDYYYLNDAAREMAQFMFENPEYKVLFDASRKVSKEDIDTVKAILDKFKGAD